MSHRNVSLQIEEEQGLFVTVFEEVGVRVGITRKPSPRWVFVFLPKNKYPNTWAVLKKLPEAMEKDKELSQ